MRKIKIPDERFTAREVDGTVRQMSALEQLRLLISVPSRPDTPFTIEDIRQRLPLVEKLEAYEKEGTKEILVEDSEFALLAQAIQQSTWSGVSRGALLLVEAIENAEMVDVKATESE